MSKIGATDLYHDRNILELFDSDIRIYECLMTLF
jgi:hypothetical protein